jgi:hypothetical protein
VAAVTKAREEKEGGAAGLGPGHKGETAGRWPDPDGVPPLRQVAMGTRAAAAALRQAGRRDQGERRRAGRPTGDRVRMGAWIGRLAGLRLPLRRTGSRRCAEWDGGRGGAR